MDPVSITSSWKSTEAGFEKNLRTLQNYKQFYAMRGDFLVAVDDFSLTRGHVLSCRKRVDCIELAYIHSASGALSLQSGKGKPRPIEITPGIRTIFPGNAKSYEVNAVFEITPEHPIKMVTIHISRAALAGLLDVPPHRLPPSLTFDPADFKNPGQAFSGPMTPSTASAVFQILNCRLEGPAKRLFIESKVLELLALETNGAFGRPGPPPSFRPDEIQRLQRARQIMMESILDPPTLPALARKVGLNEKKIKAGFRKLFGYTVYGFLQSHRMETARHLMDTRLLGVSEAAWAVGYVNVSHFSAAFRKRFGILPGAYLRTPETGNTVPRK